jgi:hypothetical protein
MIISRKTKAAILNLSGVWLFLIPIRLFNLWRTNLKPQIIAQTRWVFSSREINNHSYHPTQASKKRLAIILSKIDGLSKSDVLYYCEEIFHSNLVQDIYFKARAQEKILRNLTDREFRAGRRILYYCLARALKPKVVFEAGTAHGVGAMIILHALKMNESEGYPGKLVTADINPNAGKFLKHLPPEYCELLSFSYGDTEKVLEELSSEIDLFIHETVNIESHENKHYDLLRQKISSSGIILSPWALTGRLAEFSDRTGREYLEYTYEPENHWNVDMIAISLPANLKVLPLQAPKKHFSR